jgi:hypothetical protein
MHRATGKALSVIAVILAACSWVAGCAQQQTAHPPAVPSAGTPSATSQPSTTSKGGSGTEAGSPSTSGTDSNSGTSSTSETASNNGTSSGGGAGEAAAQEGSETPGGGPTAQTPDEQKDTLDRNLQASLGAFDAMLLKEQVEAAARRAEHGTGAGAGAGGEGEGSGEGEGGGAAGSSGSAAGAAGSEASTGEKGSGSQDKEARGTGGKGGGGDKDRATGSSGAREPREGGRVVTSDPEGAPPTGADDASRVPPDVGDGRGDDVVARQLREAAMSEEDPVIREKLWDEYRRYKRGES